MTTVLIDYSDAWVAADLEADPGEWARACIRRRAGEEKADLSVDQVGLLADVLVPALDLAGREEIPPVMLLFLLPAADEPAVCSVSVRAEGITGDTSTEDLLQEVRLPAEMLEQPAVEEVVQTRSGPAVHLVQRYLAPQGADFELVQEHEIFVWRLTDAEGDLAVYLSTSYLDLADAAQWRPQLVELAATLTVTEDSLK